MVKHRTRLRTKAIPTTCHSLFKARARQASKATKHPPQTKAGSCEEGATTTTQNMGGVSSHSNRRPLLFPDQTIASWEEKNTLRANTERRWFECRNNHPPSKHEHTFNAVDTQIQNELGRIQIFK
ncbi:MAG: hypothetical protein BYD32DRAFT_172857 [Podila humilis]|nr:MAG: hypothetical protein BYD32DRAFT_172857 [Podila humilis]